MKWIGLLFLVYLPVLGASVSGPITGIDIATGNTIKVDQSNALLLGTTSTGTLLDGTFVASIFTQTNGTYVVYEVDSLGNTIPEKWDGANLMDGYLVFRAKIFYIGKSPAELLLQTSKLTNQ